MVFVMILIRINSKGTGAAGAAGVKCFFIYYLYFTPALAHPMCFKGLYILYFCPIEKTPTLAISKRHFFHNFDAVFELSAILVLNLSLIKTLPACSSMKICWLEHRLYFAEKNSTSEQS